MRSLLLRITLALVTFVLGVSAHMLRVAYCLPDISTQHRGICYRPTRVTRCQFSR
jgi:hypothetical protein